MITRMENVGIVVEDLPAAIDFFARLGLELEGEATVDQDWAARIGGFDEVRLDVAMMRTRTATALRGLSFSALKRFRREKLRPRRCLVNREVQEPTEAAAGGTFRRRRNVHWSGSPCTPVRRRRPPGIA
jgi:catechol 2,3-dioxygenase-like lactoylglutathione lyase family enzyme